MIELSEIIPFLDVIEQRLTVVEAIHRVDPPR